MILGVFVYLRIATNIRIGRWECSSTTMLPSWSRFHFVTTGSASKQFTNKYSLFILYVIYYCMPHILLRKKIHEKWFWWKKLKKKPAWFGPHFPRTPRPVIPVRPLTFIGLPSLHFGLQKILLKFYCNFIDILLKFY